MIAVGSMFASSWKFETRTLGYRAEVISKGIRSSFFIGLKMLALDSLSKFNSMSPAASPKRYLVENIQD